MRIYSFLLDLNKAIPINMNPEIQTYNNSMSGEDKVICNLLATEISRHLPKAENKICIAIPFGFLMAIRGRLQQIKR